MKISVSRSSGNIEPNFAIIAETDADRVFLQAFDEVHAKYKKLAVGGTTYEIGKGITAFNFHIDKSASNVSGWSDDDMWEVYNSASPIFHQEVKRSAFESWLKNYKNDQRKQD